MKYANIGGQAVMEGIMMRYEDTYSVAVRTPEHKIEKKVEKRERLTKKLKVSGIPIVRGVVSFIDSLILGMKTITWSADYLNDGGETKEEKPGKLLMGFTVFLSVLLAVGIFIALPLFLAHLLSGVIENRLLLSVLEGLIRVGIFLLYIILISNLSDIKRVFQYHGAEHKTITCVEKGLELTPENAARCTRFHRRCGTSFLFLVVIISVVAFMFIQVDNIALKIIIRLLLIPVLAGLSYELIQWTGRHENVCTIILSSPGLLLQRLTTKEPDMEMLEVAIEAIEAVYDWRGFQKEAGLVKNDAV